MMNMKNVQELDDRFFYDDDTSNLAFSPASYYSNIQKSHLENLKSWKDDEKDTPTVIFSHGMPLKDIEKSVILETLRRQKFNRTKTAKTLGIGIRTLQRKLKYYREHDGDMIPEFERL